MSDVRLTIGMPAYNSERWIGESLEALLAQSYRDFRLVISDNASTDSTQAICTAFAKRDSRIDYHRQDANIGVFRNYDYVFEQCDTELFKWASANDICKPTMLEACVDALDQSPDAVLAFPQTVLFDEEQDYAEPYPDFERLEGDDPVDRFRCFFEELSLNNIMNGVIRSDALRKTSLNRVYVGSDINMTAELLLQGRLATVAEPLFFRRMSQEATAAQRSREDRYEFYSHEPTSTENWQVLRKGLWAILGALRSPTAFSTRLRAALYACRMLIWDRREIWYEVRSAFRRRRGSVSSDS